MADPNRKRSRKSRLVPRDMELDTDVDTPKASALQVLAKLNSAMARPASPDMDFKVEVECEEVDEAQQPISARPNFIHRPAYVATADLRNEMEQLFTITTSPADKTLEVELRNSWGRVMTALPLSPLDAALQEVMANWRQWYAQSRCRDVPLLYKCYACDVGFWYLNPFKEHLLATHRHINVYQESFHHEFNVIAWVGDKDERPRIRTVGIMGGKCGMCLNDHRMHISQYRSSICYTCQGCKEKFFTCLALFAHECKCQRFLQHLVKEGNVIHENKCICNICNVDCLTEDRYKRHMIGRHSVRNDTVIGTPLNKVCLICGMKYYLHHMHACYAKPATNECIYCCRKYQNKWLLTQHLAANADSTRCRTCDHFVPRRCMEVEHVIQHSSTYTLGYQCLGCPETLVFPNEEYINTHLATDHGFKAERKKGFKQLVSRVIIPISIHTLAQLEMPTRKTIATSTPLPPVQSQVKYGTGSESQLAQDGDTDHFELKSEIKIEEHDVMDQTESAMAALESAQNDDQQCFMMESEINMLLSSKKRRRISAIREEAPTDAFEIGIIDNIEPVIKKERKDSADESGIEIRDSIEEECGLIEGQIEEMLKKSIVRDDVKTEKEVVTDREDSIERECREMESVVKKQKKICNSDDKDVVVKNEEEFKRIQDEIDSLIKKRDKIMSEKKIKEENRSKNTVIRLLDSDSDDNENELYCDVLNVDYCSSKEETHEKGSIEIKVEPTTVDYTKSCVNEDMNNIKLLVNEDQDINMAVIENGDVILDEMTIELSNVKSETKEDGVLTVTDHDYLQTFANTVVEKHPQKTSCDNNANDVDNDSDCDDDLIILNSDNYNFVDLTEDDDRNDCENEKEPNESCSNESYTKVYIEDNSEEIGDKTSDFDGNSGERNDANSTRYVLSGEGYEKRLKRLYNCFKCNFVGVHKLYAEHKNICHGKSPPKANNPSEPDKKINTACNKSAKGVLKYLSTVFNSKNKTSKWPKFKCSRCNNSYNTFRKYIFHFCSKCVKSDSQGVKTDSECVKSEPLHKFSHGQCPKCLVVLDSTAKLCGHVMNHMKNSFVSVQRIGNSSTVDPEQSLFQCKSCKATVRVLDFFQHWESHLVPERMKEEKNTIGENNQSPDKEWDGIKDQLEAEQLKTTIDQLLSTKHGPNDMLKYCVMCARTFERRNDCKRHLVEHLLRDAYHYKPENHGFRCQICGDICPKPETYKQHMRNHGALPVYTCELCNKDFSDSSNFVKHKKVHNLNVVICDLCNRKFQHKGSLEKHMEIHSKIDPLPCPDCHRVFALPSALKKHQRMSHSTEARRYACVYCRQRFSSLKFKWDHMWEVHKERKHKADCPKCGQSFRKLSDVKRHLKDVHGQSLTCVYNPSKIVVTTNVDITKTKVYKVTTASVKSKRIQYVPAIKLTKEDIERQAELARLKSLWSDGHDSVRAVRDKCSRTAKSQGSKSLLKDNL